MAALDQYIPVFLLVFVRLSAFFVTAPLFSYRTIPATFKIGLAAFFAMTIMMTLKTPAISIDVTFILLVLKEACVGLTIGFVAGLIFYGLQMAGTFIDLQMGLSFASIVDPGSGVSSPLTGQYFYMIAMIFLLSVNGHYLLIDGLYYSFQLIPVNTFHLHFQTGSLIHQVLDLFIQMFIIGFQMSIPIVGSLFLVDVGMGIIARTVPQVNILVVGPPLKIMIGFIMIILVVPVYIMVVKVMVNGLEETLKSLIQLLGG